MTYRPDQLRDALSDLVGALQPRVEYVQNTTTDTQWTQSHEPFAPDLIPEDIAGMRHMLYHLEIREVGLESRVGNETMLRTTVDAYCLSAILPAGNYAPVESWNQALCMARHLWFTLADADKHLGGITSIVDQGETFYRVIPTSLEWLMGHVRISYLFPDSLEA